jgi:hypothetical protein
MANGSRNGNGTAAPWKPIVSIDFFNATGHEFHATVQKFREAVKDLPRDMSITLSDGWHTITPQVAEELLKRNTRNRPVDWSYVMAYGTQMANGRWKRTGEPVIINAVGDVDDAGHRLWACYLSGHSFSTYVVNVEADPDLFAFIDNGRARSSADTLATAGFGQQSNLLSRIVKDYAMPADEKCLAYNGRLPRPPVTNIDVLDYMRANPGMEEIVKTVRDLYPAAIKRIGDTAVGCYVGWRIQTIYGSGVLEDFFGDLVRTDLPQTHPVTVLQKRLDEHLAAINSPRTSPKRKLHLTPVKILALTIRAFNMMQAGLSTRRLDPRADDAFPEFEPIPERAEAA